MPEGPEVRVIATWLAQHITGKVLEKLEWSDKSRYAKQALPGMSHLNLPQNCTAVRVKGKTIIIELNSIYLTSKLGMAGRWTPIQGDHCDVWLKFSDGTILYYADSRHQGNLKVHPNISDLLKVLDAAVGPDLLQHGLNLWQRQIAPTSEQDVLWSAWHDKIRSPRLSLKPVCNFLREQKFFSGIGNYLRAEILYDAKIAPFRAIGSLSTQEIQTLYIQTLQVIVSAFQYGGLTISDFWDPEGRAGTYPVKVYERKTDPNGLAVVKESDNVSLSWNADRTRVIVQMKEKGEKRSIHWVPQVQI